jgi:hypothetical protein
MVFPRSLFAPPSWMKEVVCLQKGKIRAIGGQGARSRRVEGWGFLASLGQGRMIGQCCALQRENGSPGSGGVAPCARGRGGRNRRDLSTFGKQNRIEERSGSLAGRFRSLGCLGLWGRVDRWTFCASVPLARDVRRPGLGWARGRKLWCCLLIRNGKHIAKHLRIQGLSLFPFPDFGHGGNSFPGVGLLVTEFLGWSPTPAVTIVGLL